MENQENNNLSELDQLKAQYEELKQQFNQQEIVNERLMKSSIKNSANFYSRYRRTQIILYPIFAILGLFAIKFYQHYYLNDSLSLSLLWLSFCSVCFAIELWLTRKLRVRSLENTDLLTLANNARSFKRLFSIFTLLNYSMCVIIVIGVLLYKLGGNISPNLGTVILITCFILLCITLLGIAETRYKTKACDEIIRQIETSDTPVDKRKGFDKKQKWFCAAMIAVFLGLDIWAVLVDVAFLKQLPITYERTAGDFSTEGTLEIWEVYNTTPVSDKAQFLDTTRVEDNDSLVYRWSADTTELMLYTLRKTTEEGPAISSAVLDGKPIVKLVETEPHKEGTSAIVNVSMMPEATLLFRKTTENIALQSRLHKGALVMDGKVYQEWRIVNVVEMGNFFIYCNPNWSEEDVKAFCEQLVKQ